MHSTLFLHCCDRQCSQHVAITLQETTWTAPEAVASKADALKLTPEKAAIVRMLKANKMVAANLRADLRGDYPVRSDGLRTTAHVPGRCTETAERWALQS